MYFAYIQFLAFLNDTVGCCAAEIVQALVDDGYDN